MIKKKYHKSVYLFSFLSSFRHYMDNKEIFRENHASLLLKPYLKCRFLILRVKVSQFTKLVMTFSIQ